MPTIAAGAKGHRPLTPLLMSLAEPDAIAEWIMHFHLIAPRLSNNAGATIAVLLRDQFGVECLDTHHPNERCRSWAGIAMMLR